MTPIVNKTQGKKVQEAVQFFLIVFGAAFAFWKFVYQDMIVPARRPPAVMLAVTLDELDRVNGGILIRVRVTVANHSDVQVWLPALWWNVHGQKLALEDRSVDEFVNLVRPTFDAVESIVVEGNDDRLARFSSIQKGEIVAVWRESDYNLWFQPKDGTVYEQLFLVPERSFDTLRIDVQAYITKSIDKHAQTRWTIDNDGALTPTLLLKEPGWQKDNSLVASFKPESNLAHRKLLDRDRAGHNSTTASLSIRSKTSMIPKKPKSPRQ